MTMAAAQDIHPTPGGVWWNIQLGRWGFVASDDLTLDEVERIETITEVPWAVSNPLASLKQAKAWLLVCALHAGATEAEAVEFLGSLNLRGIKGAFQLHGGSAPEPPQLGPAVLAPVPPISAPTSVDG